MNTEQMINSIYNPRKKHKEPFIFPKISKAEPTPPENKVFVRGASRKYNQQNIFKIEDEKKQRVKMHIEQQRLREIRQREYEQLQLKMAAMARRHQQQMKELQQHQKKVAAEIENHKKHQYQIKYSLWELKNQIMNLNNSYLEHENEYQRLYQEVGYIEEGAEGEIEGEGPEGEGEEPLENQLEAENNENNEEGQQYNAEDQGEVGDQGEQNDDLNRAVTVEMEQPQILSQLQLQYQSHSVV